MEMLIAQLEDAFAAAGIALGRITNVALAVLAALERIAPPDELIGTLLVEEDGYTLGFLHHGEPILYRHKTLAPDLPSTARELAVRRELRLTASFLRERFPTDPVGRVFLGIATESPDRWHDWIYDELGGTPEVAMTEHLPIAPRATIPPWMVTAPLFGVATHPVS